MKVVRGLVWTLCVFTLCFGRSVYAATKTATTSTSWELGSTWGGSAPAAGDTVIIPTGLTVTLGADHSSSLVPASVELRGTAQLNLGGFNIGDGNTQLFITQSPTATITFTAGSTSANFGFVIHPVGGQLTVAYGTTGGTFTMGNGLHAGALVFSGTGTLVCEGPFNGTSTLYTGAASTAVTWNPVSATVTSGSMAIAGNVASSTFTMGGNIVVSSGATLTLGNAQAATTTVIASGATISGSGTTALGPVTLNFGTAGSITTSIVTGPASGKTANMALGASNSQTWASWTGLAGVLALTGSNTAGLTVTGVTTMLSGGLLSTAGPTITLGNGASSSLIGSITSSAVTDITLNSAVTGALSISSSVSATTLHPTLTVGASIPLTVGTNIVIDSAASVTGAGTLTLSGCNVLSGSILSTTTINGPANGVLTIIATPRTFTTFGAWAGVVNTTGASTLTLPSATIASGSARLDLSDGSTVSGSIAVSTFTLSLVSVSVSLSTTLAFPAFSGTVFIFGPLSVPTTATLSFAAGTISAGGGSVSAISAPTGTVNFNPAGGTQLTVNTGSTGVDLITISTISPYPPLSPARIFGFSCSFSI